MSILEIFKKGERKAKDYPSNHPASEAEAEEGLTSNQNKTMVEKTQKNADASSGDRQKVYNLIILDESGSMDSIYKEALSGVNETLQTIRMAGKDHPEQDHFVTLVTFDTGHYNEIYKGIPAQKAVDITTKQYRPEGCTPLYDAMGRAISELRNHLDYINSDENETVVLVTIITDGYENASREYSGAAIKALVEKMRENGWVFTYIGANQDVDKVADSLSIYNRMAFEADSEGTKAMFAKVNKSRKVFYGKLKLSREEREENFFED